MNGDRLEPRPWLNFAHEAPSNGVEDNHGLGPKSAADSGGAPGTAVVRTAVGIIQAGVSPPVGSPPEKESDAPAIGAEPAAGEQAEDMSGAVVLESRAGETQLTGGGARPSATDPTDTQLIHAVQRGDQGSFAILVRRYSERAYRAAYRVVRDPHQAEEIVQEALIKAYRGLDGFELRSSFYTWLYKIVVNLALDRRRREGRAPNIEWDDSVAGRVDPRASPPGADDPELATRRREVREFVAQGVQGLPDPQREVLLLREVEGLSYEEIAERMRISKGTVMSRLHYARKKMVMFLTQCGVDPEDVV